MYKRLQSDIEPGNVKSSSETQLQNVRVEMDGIEQDEEEQATQPKLIRLLKRFLSVDPRRRYVRKMKAINETGKEIEDTARVCTLFLFPTMFTI